jgi:hypothetical protein
MPQTRGAPSEPGDQPPSYDEDIYGAEWPELNDEEGLWEEWPEAYETESQQAELYEQWPEPSTKYPP